jgi:pimeloyl-ACP methyl ester carboxylesterase
VVVVHGINPLHPLVHLEVAQRYSEEIGARWGAGLNVLGWDWNGNTMHGPGRFRNQALAEGHGRALGEALLKAGVAPEGLHLVGHSSGSVVAVAAARTIIERTGRRVDRLTLLDPQAQQHPLIFVTLQAGEAARVVEHFWVTGPSGFGAQAPYPNVRDQAVAGPSGWTGFLIPHRLDHIELVRWHITQLASDPWAP